MIAVNATYDAGQIKFAETPPELGPVDVLVVFPETADDPWEEILAETTPRPSFTAFAEQCREEIAKRRLQ